MWPNPEVLADLVTFTEEIIFFLAELLTVIRCASWTYAWKLPKLIIPLSCRIYFSIKLKSGIAGQRKILTKLKNLLLLMATPPSPPMSLSLCPLLPSPPPPPSPNISVSTLSSPSACCRSGWWRKVSYIFTTTKV